MACPSAGATPTWLGGPLGRVTVGHAPNLSLRDEAQKVGQKLDGKSFVLIRQAGDRGQLYGSVSPRDVADAMEKAGYKVDRHQVNISQAIKAIGRQITTTRSLEIVGVAPVGFKYPGQTDIWFPAGLLPENAPTPKQ